MEVGILAAYVLLLQANWPSGFVSAFVAPHQSPLYLDKESSNYTAAIRNATLADLDDITDIIVDAFSSGSLYKYLYQFRERYAQYHWRCTRAEVQRYIETSPKNDSILKVIDSPVNENPNMSKAVSVALWEHAATAFPEPPGIFFTGNCTQHLDANVTRGTSVTRQFDIAKRRYLDDLYQPKHQLYLKLLATHPDYQGHGLGEAHCEWGLALAEEKLARLVRYVTLIATPRGFPVYESLGFESLTNVTIEGVDDEQEFWFEVMKFDVN